MLDGKDARLRRDALQIALQLPDNEADALAVLSYARDLVEDYLFRLGKGSPRPPDRPNLRIV